MKVLITGAHFTPAQAVIEELLKEPDVQITYMGRKYTREGDRSPSVESQVLPKLRVKFIPIIAGRIQRTLTPYTPLSILKIPLGFLHAFFLLIREKPDIVVSFGGYVGVPVVFASWLLSIPILIHEQTLISGLANRFSAFFADKVAISFLEKHSFNRVKTVLTGNPLRQEIIHPQKEMQADFSTLVKVATREKLPIILITGGNQGSHIINKTVANILDELLKISCIIHQTGDSSFKDFENLNERRRALKYPERYVVKKWIEADDMGGILQKVDLAVARGGINTLSELAFCGIPAVVIPIPYLYRDEQMVNVRYFQKAKLAFPLLQSQLSEKRLLETVQYILKNLKQLQGEAKEAREVVIVDAAKRLKLEILLLAKKI